MFRVRQAQGMVRWRRFVANQWAHIEPERWKHMTGMSSGSLGLAHVVKAFGEWRACYTLFKEQHRKLNAAMVKAYRGRMTRALNGMRKQQASGHLNEDAIKKARALWVADKFASCFMHWVELTIMTMEDKQAFARAQRLFNRKHNVRHYFEAWLDQANRENFDQYEHEKKVSAVASLLKERRLHARWSQWRHVAKFQGIIKAKERSNQEIKALQRELQLEKESSTREIQTREKESQLTKMKFVVLSWQNLRERRFITTATRLYIWAMKAHFNSDTLLQASSTGQSAQHLAARIGAVKLARDLGS